MGTGGDVLAAVSERPRELLDQLALPDRAAELRDRAEELRELIGDPRERFDEAREVAQQTSEAARQRAEDLEPALRNLAVQGLVAFRALIGALLVLPRLAVRALGALGDLAERAEVAREKGHEFSERARDVAHQVPPSRRMRWKRRLITAGLVGGGFALGFVSGWIVAQRTMQDPAFDEPVGLQPVADPIEPITDSGGQGDPRQRGTGA